MDKLLELRKPPTVVLVFLASLLAVPIAFLFNSLALMEDQFMVFLGASIVLCLFALLSYVFVKDSPGKKEPLFYVWSVFSFTCCVDLMIGLELDGFISNGLEFYFREGEPYLRTAFGSMINWWDGTAQYAMSLGLIALCCSGFLIALELDGFINNTMTFYLVAGEPYFQTAHGTMISWWDAFGQSTMYYSLIGLLCSGKDYRQLGLYWVGSIGNSMLTLMLGSIIGKFGVKMSYLLNIPFVFFPYWAGVRFILEGANKRSRKMGSETRSTWNKAAEIVFGVWFVAAAFTAFLRALAALGCKDELFQYYVTSIEPYLQDPNQYGKLQALVYMFYFVLFYIGAICSLIYPGQQWIKDWSLIHAGASAQAQVVFIATSLHWRTDKEFLVPETYLARSIFWTVNLSLLIMPHLFALYCHREEVAPYLIRESTPSKPRTSTVTPRRPVTRSAKKKL